ncbi:MAG: AAA family ATPase [Myxococcales bacterium]|nr:AAA family ATPase [Myxococcales bacterium]
MRLLPIPDDGIPDWKALRAAFDWVEALHHCPQDPIWHAEGDVGIHTEMVLRALVEAPGWAALGAFDRAVTWLACLLHDVSKPETTVTEHDGRITARGHSRRGAVVARRILWRLDVPFAVREAVCALIAVHQVPFFAIEGDGFEDRLKLGSQVVRNDLLARVAEADIRGRTCDDMQRLLDNIELFRLACAEQGCLDRPYVHASAHARFLHAAEGRAPVGVAPHEDFACTAALMCGLPGSGKDTWLRDHFGGWPVVTLDGIRARLGVAAGDHDGRVIQAAREAAREHLRAGRDFAWNGTHLSARRRGQLVELFAGYRARVRVVYVEASAREQARRNRARAAAVPKDVIARMLDSWEVPQPAEGHAVEWVASDGSALAADGLPGGAPWVRAPGAAIE